MFEDTEVATYTDQLIKNVLAHCSRGKQDVIGLLGTLVEDLSHLSNETYFTMVETIRKTPVSFDFADLDTFDPFLS